jgi:hypothetical protein
MRWRTTSRFRPGPADVVQRLERATNEVLTRPDGQERAKTIGIEMRGSTPHSMTELMTNEIAKL